MSGNNINGDAPAGDRLPPPAFPRGRRRWRVPAPPPDANPPFEADLSPTEAAPLSLNDDVEVLPAEWLVRKESLQDEVVTLEAVPAVRTQPPVLPECFEEDLADSLPEQAEAQAEVVGDFGPDPALAAEEVVADLAPQPIDDAEDLEADLVAEPTEAPEELVGDLAPEPAEAWEDVVGELVPEAAEGWEEAEVELVPETTEAAPEQDTGSETDPGYPLESAPVDPHVEAVMALVRRLADDLEAHGETALAADAEVSPFEATLRAYCVGYLEGLRELESSDPDTP